MTSSSDIGDDYYTSLQTLTFNSRPIIESHTALAQENVQFAPEIVTAIEKRIEKAIPSHKLFALYLLDSISKNIGLPYTSLFSKNLFRTFTTTYGLVDDPTRCRLIKLFKTWKIPTAVTGMPLFDSNQLDKIEQFLIKVTANANPGNTGTPPSNSANPINNTGGSILGKSKFQLVSETNDLLNIVNKRLSSTESQDEKGQQRFALLNQLKSILSSNSSIPQIQLDEVSKQLQTIRDDELLKLNTLRQQQEEAARKAQAAAQRQQQQQQQQQQMNASTLQNLLNLTKPQDQTARTQDSTTTITGNALGLTNISFLQNILKKADSSSMSPPTGGAMAAQPNRLDFNFIRPTRDSILEDFKLDQSFISKHTPTNIEISLLYEFNPIQCPLCPRRFEDSLDGKSGKENHLMWHSRVEKRLNSRGSGMGGVINRSWYLELQEWLEFNDSNDENGTLEKQTNNHFINGDGDTRSRDRDRGDSQDTNFDPKDADTHVVIIPESSNNEIICGICHDELTGVYDEDSGDWVWKNAVKDESRKRVVHWTCWMETRSSRLRDRSPTRN